jgi:hypothetical protein
MMIKNALLMQSVGDLRHKSLYLWCNQERTKIKYKGQTGYKLVDHDEWVLQLAYEKPHGEYCQ